MQLINGKTYIPIVCVAYTIISLCKIVLEAIEGYHDSYYAVNFITILFISLISTFILGLHYYLQKFPLTIVIVGQYLSLFGIIMLSLWISSQFQKLAATAYRDIFWSFTIPYIIGAIIYYISFLFQIRKANLTLKEIKREGKKLDEH